MNDDSSAVEPDAQLRSLLEHMLRIEASELYLSAGSPPVFRVQDVPYPGRVALQAPEVAALADSLLSAAQRDELRAVLELNVVHVLGSGARFAVNLFWQRGAPGLVVRALPSRVRTLDELGHPPLFKQLAVERCGLLLIAGARGSGKSTTIAALVAQRGEHGGHIVTVEDPIELMHPPMPAVITQRELGVDTRSYVDALRNAARQAPDMVVVDAIRSADVLDALLALAVDGPRCVAAVTATSTVAAIDRLLSLVPSARQGEIRMRLASCLRAVIAQRLVPADGGGRVAMFEVLELGPAFKDLLERGELRELASAVSDPLAGTSDSGPAFNPVSLRFAPELPRTAR